VSLSRNVTVVPAATVSVDGVKLSDMLVPTPCGIATVSALLEPELDELDELDVLLVMDVLLLLAELDVLLVMDADVVAHEEETIDAVVELLPVEELEADMEVSVLDDVEHATELVVIEVLLVVDVVFEADVLGVELVLTIVVFEADVLGVELVLTIVVLLVEGEPETDVELVDVVETDVVVVVVEGRVA
jgi:hypothetical protein